MTVFADNTYKDFYDVTVDDTFRRVAKAIASVETTETKQIEWEDKFYDMLSDFKGTPGGRTYANAGTQYHGTTLLNCFVSPRSKFDIDSLDKILDDVKNQSFTLKSEGGWGQNFSWIRPRGSFIHSIGVESPGAVKYMEIYDKTSDIITAGSGKKTTNIKAKKKIRKGAMMAVLDCWHPDIIEFITAKQQPGRLTKFNMSVNCTDDFMEKVITGIDDNWDLIFPETTFEKYQTEWYGDINDWKQKNYPVIVYKTISVKYLWNLIMESTYNRAEPGVLFLDRANDLNPLYYGEHISSTNPCLRGDVNITTTEGDISIENLTQQFQNGKSFQVKTYNTKTNEIEIENVINAFMTSPDKKLLELVFDDGNKLYVTPDHKIYTKNRGYVEAQFLTSDDDIVLV